MTLEPGALIQFLLVLLVSVIGWNVRTFRADWLESREDMQRKVHDLRNQLAPIATDVAVIKAMREREQDEPSRIAVAVAAAVKEVIRNE